MTDIDSAGSKLKKLTLNDENGECSTAEKEPSDFDFETSDFKVVIKKKYFVDKSLLIKELSNFAEKRIIISAPSKFGKSTNLSMLKYFFQTDLDENGTVIKRSKTSPNYKFFKENNLFIARDMNTFGKSFARFIVIHVDFKTINGTNFVKCLDQFRMVLHQTYKQFPYLLKSQKLDKIQIDYFKKYYDEEQYKNLTEKEVYEGFQHLNIYISKHFPDEKIIVLIDNYDKPVHSFVDNRYFDNLLSFIEFYEQMLSYLMNSDQIEKVIIFGIISFSLHLNYVPNMLFLSNHEFVPYFGLTEVELCNLFRKYKIESDIKTQVKTFYGEYISKTGIQLYPLFSILKFLQTNKIKYYFPENRKLPNLRIFHARKFKPFFTMSSNDITIMDLLNQYLCNEKTGLIEEKVHQIFLLQQGYLTYEEIKKDTCTLVIANLEIFQELNQLLSYSDSLPKVF